MKIVRALFEDKMHSSWLNELESVLCSPQMADTYARIAHAKNKGITIYPPFEICFRALLLTPLREVRVVLLGQDVYHDGSAVGLAFANADTPGKPISPSLRVIFREIEQDVYNGVMLNQDPTLEDWAVQGVLLLNTSLTVEKGKPGSHLELWKLLIYRILAVLRENLTGVIYVLWGKHAQSYKPAIDGNLNHILEAPHPASELYKPGSGFLGCGHFSKINQIIEQANGQAYKIKW